MYISIYIHLHKYYCVEYIGIVLICGMMRLKVADPSQRPVQYVTVVETIVKCEARLPLFTCRQVPVNSTHMYELYAECKIFL